MNARARMLYVGCLVLCGTGFLGACRGTGANTVRAPVTPAAERAVYEALLRSAYLQDGAEVAVLDPDMNIWEGPVGARPDGMPRDAWTAFVAAHQRARATLPRKLDPGVPVAWFTRGEFDALPGRNNLPGQWASFRERFPNSTGWIRLGPIGFSRDGRTAVVNGSVGSGALSASSDAFVLQRTATGWRLSKTHNISIA